MLAAGCASGLVLPSYTDADLEEEQAVFARELVAERIAWGAVVQELEFSLATAAAPFCPGLWQPRLGGVIASEKSFTGRYARPAASSLGLGPRPAIVSVVPGGPLDVAGLRAGDVLVRVAGEPVVREEDIVARLTASPEDVALEVERSGVGVVARVRPAPACPVTVGYARSAQLLPVARGRTSAVVPRAMLVLFETMDARAVLLAHQLAHLLFDRPEDDALTSERRADRLGLYLAARAGYDVSDAVAVWETLVAEYPWLASPRSNDRYRAYPHRSVALRTGAMRDVIDEIAAKRARGEPLVPSAD
jgi:hypothetical protein